MWDRAAGDGDGGLGIGMGPDGMGDWGRDCEDGMG